MYRLTENKLKKQPVAKLIIIFVMIFPSVAAEFHNLYIIPNIDLYAMLCTNPM